MPKPIKLDAKAVIQAALPFNRKKKFFVKPYLSGETYHAYGRYWDGGSKNEYTIFHPITGEKKAIAAIFNPLSKFDENVVVPLGFVVICHGTFCGKAATPSIDYRPEEYVFE